MRHLRLLASVLLLGLAMHALAQPTHYSSSSASATTGSVTVNKPSGVYLGVVMVAAVAVTPSTALFTAPAGWTFLGRSDNAGPTSNSLLVYSKVVGASEPASYTWSAVNGNGGSAVGISAFTGVNSANPINTVQFQSGTTNNLFVAPSVTPSTKQAMIVTWHAYASSTTWNPPSGMTEMVDVSSLTAPNAGGVSLCGSRLYHPTNTATGALVAIADGSFYDAGNAFTVALNPANTVPTGTNLNLPEAYTEDTPLNLADMVVDDPQQLNLTVTCTLSAPAIGALSTATAGSTTSTYTAATGVWSASGPIAEVNTLLAGLTFTPALNVNGTLILAIAISDGELVLNADKNFTGIPVNDAPTAINLGADQNFTEDVPLNLIDVVVNDVDNANLTVTFGMGMGTGSLSTATVGSTTSSFAGGTWTASGPIAEVNALLAGLVYSPPLNFSGQLVIFTYVSDGALTISDYKSLTANDVNDAPVNTLPAPPSTPQNTPLTMSGSGAISVWDVDAYPSFNVRVTLSVSNGALSVASTAGLSFTVGTGVNNSTMTFTGQLASVNGAMNGMTFTPAAGFYGTSQLTITTSDLGNYGSGGVLTDTDVLNISVVPLTVQVALKAMLDGPYDAGTGLMSDALRSGGLLPLTEPYTALGYAHVGGGGETVLQSVLNTTGNNGIVDWVVVELRNNADPTVIVASKSALIQRDGDVVDVNGTSSVTFIAAPATYQVALRHRNHLGVMTQTGFALTSGPTSIDFSSIATGTNGTQALKSVSGAFPVQALWSGDVNFNGNVQYTGSNNDRDPILVAIGGTTPNNVVNAYAGTDVNLDGQVKYTGANNDRDPILVNVGGTTPNNVRMQQLP